MKAIIALAIVCIGLAAATIKVKTANQRFVDAHGRERVFHGINAVFKTVPWLPTYSGPFDHKNSLNDKDMEDLKAWGFNVVRLGVMWPAVEPERGKFDMEYLHRVREMIDALGKHGIYTIADAHQDLYGRSLCGEGAADWAVIVPEGTHPFPYPLTNHTLPVDEDGYPLLSACLERQFGLYYMTEAVGAAFQSLYDNVDGIQDEFAEFWRVVAKELGSSEYLLGYDLLNEPWAGDVFRHPSLLIPGQAGKRNLLPMYQKLHKAIRTVDDEHMIFFEKTPVNFVLSTGLDGGPGGPEYNDRQVFGYHDYCFNIDRNGNPSNLFVCEATQLVQWWSEIDEAKKLGGGMMLTEFGAFGPNSTKAMSDLEWQAGLADDYMQSWAYWQFKSYNDFTTASNDGESFYNADGSLQTVKVNILSRVYAQAVAGTASSMSFTPKSGKFVLKYDINTAIAEPTEIWIPDHAYGSKGYKVTLHPSKVAEWSAEEQGRRVLVKPVSGAKDGTTLTVTITAA